MTIEALTINEYLEKLPEDRKEIIEKLRNTILENLPEGYSEGISYGMIGYVVPHEVYPAGYHCNPKLPLPFISIASQKNHIGFYHMGIYSDQNLMNWFTEEYKKFTTKKLDMGKGCVRFKKAADIPYDLIGQLVTKIPAASWIKMYEENLKK